MGDFGWLDELPNEYFRTGHYYVIDVADATFDERCKIQQFILDQGITWHTREDKLKRAHCSDVNAYVINDEGTMGYLPKPLDIESFVQDNERYKDAIIINYKDLISTKQIKESEDFDWVDDVEYYPTLGELFDNGMISNGDVIELQGEVVSYNPDDNRKVTWINSFKIEMVSIKDGVIYSEFNILTNTDEVVKAMGVQGPMVLALMEEDLKLKVISLNGKLPVIKPLVESNDFDWVDDLEPFVELKTRTIYYAEPPLTPKETLKFMNSIINRSKMLNTLRNRLISDPQNLSYLAIDGSFNDFGWDMHGGLKQAIEFNPWRRGSEIVDIRDLDIF